MDQLDNRIFEPDVTLASELLTTRTGLPDPERMLLIAVLEDASRCFLQHCTATERKPRVLYEEARDWFFSKENGRLFDFESVCDVLGIDADYLRRRMRAERDRRRAAAARGSATSVA